MEVSGGPSFREVALDRSAAEKAREPIVESVALHISERAASRVSWEIDLYVQTDESMHFLARFITPPPFVTGEPASRVFAIATVPGARHWRMSARGTLGAGGSPVPASQLKADFFISASREGGCCGAHPLGWTRRVPRPGKAGGPRRYVAGAGAGSVAVPAGGLLRTVSGAAPVAGGTIVVSTIAGPAIPVPLGTGFSHDFDGKQQGPLTVLFGGALSGWFVAWDEVEGP